MAHDLGHDLQCLSKAFHQQSASANSASLVISRSTNTELAIDTSISISALDLRLRADEQAFVVTRTSAAISDLALRQDRVERGQRLAGVASTIISYECDTERGSADAGQLAVERRILLKQYRTLQG